jgi:hypothetical protein
MALSCIRLVCQHIRESLLLLELHCNIGFNFHCCNAHTFLQALVSITSQFLILRSSLSCQYWSSGLLLMCTVADSQSYCQILMTLTKCLISGDCFSSYSDTILQVIQHTLVSHMLEAPDLVASSFEISENKPTHGVITQE